MNRRRECLVARQMIAGDDLTPDVVRAARAHTTSCPSCSALLDDDVPRRRLPRMANSTNVLRGLIIAAVVTQLTFAVPWLFGHSLIHLGGHAARDHLTRDGALGVIASIAGALTALRARASVPMLWVCVAVTALQTI